MQTKRKEQEHEQPMTTTALIIHTAAAAGPRKLTPAQLTVDDAQFQALFASSLQRSDPPGADAVTEAIRVTVQQLGTDGCLAGWRRSSATTRRQQPSACTGSGRC
jgi:hypothetical protein